MRPLPILLAATFCTLAAVSLIAQEAKEVSDAHSVVSIEILLADVGGGDKSDGKADDQAVIARVLELEKQGKLTRATRLRWTARQRLSCAGAVWRLAAR